MFRGTTILSVRRDREVVVGGDGQVTLGETVVKANAKKVRKIYNGEVIVGFAGGVADALALFDKFEGKLQEYGGSLRRAAVELAKLWRTDRYLRRLEALLIAANREASLLISGDGEVLEPEEGILTIGSGGPYALAAARALVRNTSLSAEDIVKQALKIASEICIYTNDNIMIEKLTW